MITKFTAGNPFPTDAVVKEIPSVTSLPDYISISADKCTLSMSLSKDDIIYGLGENMHGINKRGFCYVSSCTDDPVHTEERKSLYGAHNFTILDGERLYGLFIDYPAKVTYDIGFTDKDLMTVTIEEPDYDLYIIEAGSTMDIIKEFRELIGPSYIPPKWAFGYQQSRWGYKSEDDIREVVKGHRDNHLPLDAVYMDIDYMTDYKDFTINEATFPDFKEFVNEMKSRNIHLVPIIDAGVKIEKGYDIYEEGCEKGYFCRKEDGSYFVPAVWPGRVHMPDFLNPDARKWFGDHYDFLIDQGIDGFWNDMNEPSLFYCDESLKEVMAKVQEYADKELNLQELWDFQGQVNSLANNPEDYKRFYHKVGDSMVRHDRVHNIYGYNMTRAAGEAFVRNHPDKKILLFSRSSYIGMHRYGGIWTGDNISWWSHIELLIHMLPNLNMCGFLYIGGDTGGFGGNASEELLMRFIELSMFTPLMRNHAALGTRDQEIYRFKDIGSFRNLLGIRYGLIPYLYSEFIKSVKNNTLFFTPLGIAFPDDPLARKVEDELLVGENIMIAPVYRPNATGRYVYLPEDMTMLRMRSVTDIDIEELPAGHHYIPVQVNETAVFVRKGKVLPLGKAAESIDGISTDDFTPYGDTNGTYTMYTDENSCKIFNF